MTGDMNTAICVIESSPIELIIVARNTVIDSAVTIATVTVVVIVKILIN